jgi:hypothetical protein
MAKELKDTKRMNRGRFLSFLGKIGVLTFLTSLPVFAAEAKLRAVARDETRTLKRSFSRLRYSDILRSPTIKGKKLGKGVLEAKLETKNLENIRDVLTGRFFGKVAEEVFKNGYVPMINWDLGTRGSDSGCFLYADTNMYSESPDLRIALDECGIHVTGFIDKGKYIIEITNIHAGGGGGEVTVPGCGMDCTGYCTIKGECLGKCGTYCAPHAALNLGEIVSYPGDKFASELLKILGTTDVGDIQRELKDVIFSDEVLNMGLQHIVLAANDSIAKGIESGQFGL